VVAAYLVAVALAGLWLIVPWLVCITALGILAGRTWTAARTQRSVPWWPAHCQAWMRLVFTGVSAVSVLALAAYCIAGRWPTREPVVDLEFPLRRGTYVVVNGGSHELINAHLTTLTSPQFRDYRGQSYGLDIMAVNAAGLRAAGVLPRNPAAYVIFGEPIHAPCSGPVLRAGDGRTDMTPPRPDREVMAGNFVFLECGGVHVLLAHMQQGTVQVRAGDRVSAGDVLGRVGNSGNSNEPHLHIHAQRPAPGVAWLGGDPLPIRLERRFLARNDRVTRR
jgi:hypothetical protein